QGANDHHKSDNENSRDLHDEAECQTWGWGGDEVSTETGTNNAMHPVEHPSEAQGGTREDESNPRTGGQAAEKAEMLAQMVSEILKHGNDRQRDFLEKEICEIAVKWPNILPTLRESENQERQVYANVATKYGAPQQSVATTGFVSIAPIRRTAQKRQESVPLDILETANDDPTTISSMFLQLGKEQAQSARGTTKRARSAEQNSASQQVVTQSQMTPTGPGPRRERERMNSSNVSDNGVGNGVGMHGLRSAICPAMLYPVHGPMAMLGPQQMMPIAPSFSNPNGFMQHPCMLPHGHAYTMHAHNGSFLPHSSQRPSGQ
ncbi:MAG: hypothetical protein Q7U84_07770, partial [Polynucleobacter sp.]|nr:hypothetical protein [Polynucleobacter sp.]